MMYYTYTLYSHCCQHVICVYTYNIPYIRSTSTCMGTPSFAKCATTPRSSFFSTIIGTGITSGGTADSW